MNCLIDIRTLTLEDVSRLVDWSAQEGWNPSSHDAEAFYAADPQGFLGCFVDGELAAGIAGVSYGERFGFIGLYITHPDFRGRGYGLKVWNAALSRLSGRTIGLDGVPAQQSNYETMGFRKASESKRWSAALSETAISPDAEIAISSKFEEIMPFDLKFFPAKRGGFLRKWLAHPRTAFVARRNGAVAGYVVVRRCLEGFKVGPLFADDAHIAHALLGACGTISNGAVVHLDVPDMQTAFIQQLEELGFQPGLETARMYLGPPPQLDLSGVFAITTLELG